MRFSQEEFLAFEQPFVAIILTVELLGNRPLNDTGVVYVTTQDGTALGKHTLHNVCNIHVYCAAGHFT